MKNAQLRAAILGALVADAASLGFHWLYDQERIKSLEPDHPEFRAPSADDYEGVAGFFAHGSKQPGDLTHYGEQLLVLLKTISETGGEFSKIHYEDSFRAHFGYGGDYVGYIDHPIRETLDNMAGAEREALGKAKALCASCDTRTKEMMVSKVLAVLKSFEGEELRIKLEEAVRLTHDDDEMVVLAFAMLSELQQIGKFHGADDEQLPAISKIPALLACKGGLGQLALLVEPAVRVTNNNDRAVEFGLAAADIIAGAIRTGDPAKAVSNPGERTSAAVLGLIEEASARQHEESPAATKHFGMSCSLKFGFPSIVHSCLTADSYQSAIRQNIYGGGDSSGRAILLGALFGAAYGEGGDKGIPSEWIARLTKIDPIESLLNSAP